MIYSIPWIFFGRNSIFQSYKRKISYKTFVFFVIYPYSIFRKLINFGFNYKKLRKINKILLLKACVINSFKFSELYYYNLVGINDWKTLSKFVPNSLSGQYLTYKRSFYTYSSNEAINFLGDKRKIHLITPIIWRPPFKYLKKKYNEKETDPDWWVESLKTKGIIIKPNESSASKGLIKLTWDGNNIFFTTSTTSDKYLKKIKINTIPTLKVAKKIWQKIFHKDKDLLIMPFLENTKNFPESSSTVILRVITKHKKNMSSVYSSWIELPINEKKVVIFSLDGNYLPVLFNLNYRDQKLISNWSNFLPNQEFQEIYQKIFNASILMHEKIPKIDKVAWDWVIGNNKYFLLEGNSLFGLLTPQLINYLNYKI